MTVLGIINIHTITRILNAMHKAKAVELHVVKEEVLYIMLELRWHSHEFTSHGQGFVQVYNSMEVILITILIIQNYL